MRNVCLAWQNKMDEPYFHVRSISGILETSGLPSCFLGHELDRAGDVKADGVFASWFWNGTELTIRNDRYGFYPLYYFAREGEIGVSTSILTLLDMGAPTELDEEGLSVFLRIGYFIGENTPFKHIRALPPDASFEWKNGRVQTSGSRYIPVKPQYLSRDKAIKKYISLFKTAIQRRLPPDGNFAVPLSGGRDSRHIVLELCETGHRPRFCPTFRNYLPHPNEDVRIASLVTKALDVNHIVIDQRQPHFKSEITVNIKTNLCSDEHYAALVMTGYLNGRVRTVYDGIGGDVLSAGLFLDRQKLTLFESGRLTELANQLLTNSEKTLEKLLIRDHYSKMSRDLAVSALIRELEKHVNAPNPVGSFIFWNRTRREIALVPYCLMSEIPVVFSPYLDHNLFDFLASLPASVLLDHNFHTDTILAAYPKYSGIPFENKDARPQESRWHYSHFPTPITSYCLSKRTEKLRLVRRSYLIPRLLKCLVSPQYTLTPFVLYLLQLGMVASLNRSCVKRKPELYTV